MYTLLAVNPVTDPRWQHFVESGCSTIFHAPAWLRALTDTYPFDIQAFMLLDEAGAPVAGLPFACIQDYFTQRTATLPFSDYCDPLADTPEQWRMLSDALLSRNQIAAIRPVHNLLPLADTRFVQVNQAKWHGIDVTPGEDEIWKRFTHKTPWGIRKAERDGATISIRQDREAMREFFELHLGIRRRKYRMLAQPTAFFENIWTHWIEPGNGAVLTVRFGDKPVSGTVLLRWRDKLVYKFSASVRAETTGSPNDLMMWEVIRYAKSLGCTSVDMGLSDWDQEGLLHFKRKFATEEKTIHFLKHTPPGFVPNPAEKEWRSLLGQMTQLFTDPSVPDAVTENAGNSLYRFFV